MPINLENGKNYSSPISLRYFESHPKLIEMESGLISPRIFKLEPSPTASVIPITIKRPLEKPSFERPPSH